MSSALYSLGRWAYTAHRLVLGIWIAIIILFAGLAGVFGQGTANNFSIPGTESQEALDSLNATFPQVSGASGQIILVTEGDIETAAVKAEVADAVTQIADLADVASATDPFSGAVEGAIAKNGHAALIAIQFDSDALNIPQSTETALHDLTVHLEEALPGSQAVLGGSAFSTVIPGITPTEGIGVLIALVVLLLTFGSFIAAGLPLLNALVGVGLSMLAITLATAFGEVASTTLMLALMLGLAVGIDYALFILARHREQLSTGMDPRESAARATATAGSAVVFAGTTVIIALLGLFVAGIPFLTTMGIGAAAAVLFAVLVSLTLVPAMLGFAGERLRPKVRPARSTRARARAERTAARVAAHPDEAGQNRFFLGWVRVVTKHPVVTIVSVVLALGVASIPALQLRLALPDGGVAAVGTEPRTAYDLTAENFGPGFNGPLILTGTIVDSTDPVTLMTDIADEIRALPGVEAVPLATPNATADTGIVQVVPTGGPNSQETQDLVTELRGLQPHFLEKYNVELSVTGFTAIAIDVSTQLGAALLPFALLVVGLSLVLLTMVFRSIWVPVKATLGYLLSVGVAFGAVAAVFELGWFSDALHVAALGPVISFMPIILMGVLFGLAMDYEVFLVARMREEYVHGRSARAAIEHGFTGSAKVVTAAAVIMFAVFAAFIPEGDSSIKPIALGLAVGVFVDAFIVRMMFVPAVLALLGDRAWHMPRWLDRILPSFDVEGEGIAHELELRDWPEPNNTDAVVGAGVRVNAATEAFGIAVQPGRVALIGGDPTAVSDTLLVLAGRAEPLGGKLKVAGYVLPTRAGRVRKSVAWIELGSASDADIERTLAENPPILALDGADRISALRRDRLRVLLAAHDAPRTLLIGGDHAADLVGGAQLATATTLHLEPARAAHPEEAGVTA